MRKMASTYSRVLAEYNQHLKEKGVKRLGEKSGFGQALCCLYENIGKPVSIDEIRKYVVEHGIVLPGGGDSLQIRHLALQYGYNMLKGEEMNTVTGIKVPTSNFLLINLTDKHPSFIPKRRNVVMTDHDWETLKEEYGNMCVNCGSKEGEPLRWNKNNKTVLQQGHMDPRLELTLANTIPQCTTCNQQYKNKAVFNNRGFVIEFNKDGFN
jgi:hypothetical protein